MRDTNQLRAFTLIELLIVVAIIAILAAIAVPNFLEAQTRSKVSRAKADMRTIATALESYAVDFNKYPPDALFYSNFGPGGFAEKPLFNLTTPIAFLTSIPTNPFPNETDQPANSDLPQFRYYSEFWKDLQLAGNSNNPLYPNTPFIWSLTSSGPNGLSNLGEYLVFGVETFDQKFPNFLPAFNAGPSVLYDPTNGTVSDGDIVVIGPGNVQYN